MSCKRKKKTQHGVAREKGVVRGREEGGELAQNPSETHEITFLLSIEVHTNLEEGYEDKKKMPVVAKKIHETTKHTQAANTTAPVIDDILSKTRDRETFGRSDIIRKIPPLC